MEPIGSSQERMAMTGRRQADVQKFEGRTVSVALADGSVLDRVPVILARRNSLWTVVDGEDTFVPLDRVVDVWEAAPFRAAA
ncbi:MAG: hypothetical protein M3203_04955 [Actinomycetota bacterium]|nr:hypothetical protein [Actinomycetota bacterium]